MEKHFWVVKSSTNLRLVVLLLFFCGISCCYGAESFVSGERLFYDVHAWFGERSSHKVRLGSAEFSVGTMTLKGKQVFVLTLVAQGHFMGQRLEVKYQATIDPKSLRTIDYSQMRSGDKVHQKRLLFQQNKISYWKKGRLRLADGSKSDQRVMTLRWEHVLAKSTEPIYDILSALYRIRSFDLGVEQNQKQSMGVVDGKDLWRLQVEAKTPEVLTLPIGKISAIPIRLLTTPLNKHAKKSDQGGLYDLEGQIFLWLDSQHHRIVQVRGDLSGGVPMQAEMVLRKVQVQAEH